MKWLLVLGFLALVGCAEKEPSAEMPNRVVIGRGTGASGAALFYALDRTAQLGGGLTAEFHDKQGKFEILVVALSENSPTISIDMHSVEVLFRSVAYGGQQVSDEDLEEKLKTLVAAVERLDSSLILEVSAIESSSSADAVRYLRLISECGIQHCRLSGQFVSQPVN